MKYFILCFIALFMSNCTGETPEKQAEYQYINDLKDQRMAVLMGSAAELRLNQRFPDMKMDRFETEADMIQALKQNRCDAVGLDGYTAHFLNTETKAGLATLDDALDTMSLAAAFPKGKNRELREQFNAFLKAIKADGSHAKMVDQWINHTEDAQMPDLKMPTQGTPIEVGVCLTLPPTSFLLGRDPVGLDIELIKRFSLFVNRPIKLTSLNFGALITSLTTNKIDMVLSSLSITEERMESIDFSDSYLDYALAVMVRQTEKKGFVPSADAITAEEDQPWIDDIEDSFHNNLIKEQRYEMVMNGLKITMIIAFFSAICGTLLGAFICFLRMRKSPFFQKLALVYISVMRGTPVLVLLLIMFYVVFNQVDIDPVIVSVITFSLNFSAYVSEMFRTAIEGIDHGQTEAGVALGFSKLRTFYHIVMPQAFKQVLPVYKGELISMVKMTSIVGYIAVEDLTKVSDIIRSRTFDALFPLVMVAILYFIIAWLFATVLDLIGRRFH